ncbi:MAG: DnaA regulatory inactivator Hda [Coxiellaceae bacterium]|jgi:DnaA family protein|nr:DnaA regulatory inactivator Hda [Coxiellaceae bacterium]
MELKQLAFNLSIKDPASFNNFFVGSNIQLITTLNNLYLDVDPCCIYLWGKESSGKSHLLGALCQLFNEHDLSAAYLPLEDAYQFTVNILDDFNDIDIFCIDDLHLIAGNLKWEEKIFYSVNNILTHNKKIVITANTSPQALQIKLLDLKSRLLGNMIFELHALSDEEKIISLKLRAKSRGLELTDGVASFLLNHYKRDAHSLFDSLNKLDIASLKAQRKLTIPFVKDILLK